jgi:hypothetical protein
VSAARRVPEASDPTPPRPKSAWPGELNTLEAKPSQPFCPSVTATNLAVLWLNATAGGLAEIERIASGTTGETSRWGTTEKGRRPIATRIPAPSILRALDSLQLAEPPAQGENTGGSANP